MLRNLFLLTLYSQRPHKLQQPNHATAERGCAEAPQGVSILLPFIPAVVCEKESAGGGRERGITG